MTEEHKKKISIANKGQERPNFKGEKNPFFGKKHKEESKKKMSVAKKGKHISPATEFKKGQIGWSRNKHILHKGSFKKGNQHWNWKGGISDERRRAWATLEYKLWRTAIFERDNYTCVWCGQRGGILNADHIKPWALFPELRFAIDNGRTLCLLCHRTTYTYGGGSKNRFGNPN